MEKISRIAAIKRYFELDGGRQVTMGEMKSLTKDDISWLATECAKALGCELMSV